MNNSFESDPLIERATTVINLLRQYDLHLVTAESCTGGMIATTITDIAGSSDVFDRSFVTYSNIAKSEMLGVKLELIDNHGAVSSEVAAVMAENALASSMGDISISVTGIAGPGGGSEQKPVGLVWFACACIWAPTFVVKQQFPNNGRSYIRRFATLFALDLAHSTLKDSPKSLSEDTPMGNA